MRTWLRQRHPASPARGERLRPARADDLAGHPRRRDRRPAGDLRRWRVRARAGRPHGNGLGDRWTRTSSTTAARPWANIHLVTRGRDAEPGGASRELRVDRRRERQPVLRRSAAAPARRSATSRRCRSTRPRSPRSRWRSSPSFRRRSSRRRPARRRPARPAIRPSTPRRHRPGALPITTVRGAGQQPLPRLHLHAVRLSRRVCGPPADCPADNGTTLKTDFKTKIVTIIIRLLKPDGTLVPTSDAPRGILAQGDARR